MIYDYLVIRYGELSLKGKNKKKFIYKLDETVREKLQGFPMLKIYKHFDDIEIQLNGEQDHKVADILTRIFGIHAIYPAVKADNDIEIIKKRTLTIISEEDVRTFKISAKRKNKQFPITSNDLNHIIGGHVLANIENLTVDVHRPDLDLRVEVMDHETRIYGKPYKGAGGLPVGTGGKVLLMLSGGIDSPVAGYLLQKRGATIEAVHFHSPPYTNDRARQKVIDLVEKLQAFGAPIKLHIVPFTTIQVSIKDKMPDNYSMTIMRRMMLRIAGGLAEKSQALAIATGESLGQVASQTLESMHTINEVTNLPVLRPLLSMDKLEIMDIAHKIDTYDISIRPYEDCCTIFLPSAPKTKPQRRHANKFEQYLPVDELVTEALAGVKTIEIGRGDDENFIDQLL